MTKRCIRAGPCSAGASLRECSRIAGQRSWPRLARCRATRRHSRPLSRRGWTACVSTSRTAPKPSTRRAHAVRVPFSVYLKPWQQSWDFDVDVLANLQSLFVIPLQGIDWRQGVATMRDARLTVKLAGRASSKIPDATPGTAKLLRAYEQSKLAKFHADFYSQEQHPPKRWPETYDRQPLDILPACARIALEQPNDLLLRPAFIRRLVRVMLALGWHPRHIAGLICSKYRRDFGWTQFVNVDPATRADFYTRVFAGLFAAGTDDLVDFNCASAQEQGTCTFSNCGFNLLNFKESALQRRAHDKLAHRPFNRLLLSSEHS